MNIETRDRAIRIAKKFISLAESIPTRTMSRFESGTVTEIGEYKFLEVGTKLSAETRRVSMELTRALAEMRKP